MLLSRHLSYQYITGNSRLEGRLIVSLSTRGNLLQSSATPARKDHSAIYNRGASSNRLKEGSSSTVPQQYTSQKCSECGRVDADNRPSQAVFHCRSCGHTENADTNAAKNVLREGLSRLACPERGADQIGHGETVQSDRALKQEVRSRLVA